MCEQEAAERNAAPEASGHEADARGVGVPVGNEEGDELAGDGDLGALVREDKERPEKRRSVAQS